MVAWSWDVPYEAQEHPASCGAAALAMVYRSLGLAESQETIWRCLESGSARGTLTVNLARHALDRSLIASVIQVGDPWLLLERCGEQDVRVIVSHRPQLGRGGGHFSVLAALDESTVLLHDPSLGPRRLPRAEFLELWQAARPGAMIAGSIVLTIAYAHPVPVWECPLCDHNGVETLRCAGCAGAFVTGPMAILGCLREGCPMRSWERLHCPYCDRAWSGPAKEG
jgi:hypothetical protein